MKLSYILYTLLGLSVCLSCNKEPADEEKPLPKKTIGLSFEEALYLDRFFPELATTPSVRYDGEMGYYIPLGEKEWTRTYSCGPTYIPSQSTSFVAKATRVEDEGFSGWYADDLSYTLLQDVRLPEGAELLYMGECSSEFKLHISLGEHVPYRKVTLQDLSIRFPDWFRASLTDAVYGSIPELEVTAEGVDVSLQLISVMAPADLYSGQFYDEEGRLCYSIETTFDALVSALPEDALEPVAEPPSTLDFRCTFAFDRIDFTRCNFTFQEVSFSPDMLVWDAIQLPSFLCSGNTDISLPQPRLLFEYWSDFPFDDSHIEVIAYSGDQEAAFTVSDNATFLFLSREDGVYRGDILNRECKAFENLFHTPFTGGSLQPSLSLQPAMENSGAIVPGQEYRMCAKADWTVPLAFNGQIDRESIPTRPLTLDGELLGAVANSAHTIRQKVAGHLPFDCRVTPVFTVEGEEPEFLDPFILDKKNSMVEFSFVYTPSTDHWKATLHYLVAPVRGTDEYLKKTDGLFISDSEFWLNMPGR